MISHDALRMRLRRLCEVKAKTNKCHVDTKTHEMWKNGGESREWLEIALTETLDKLGPCNKGQHKKLRVSWTGSAKVQSSEKAKLTTKYCSEPHATFWSTVYKCVVPLYSTLCFRLSFLLVSLWCGSAWKRKSRRSTGSGWRNWRWKRAESTVRN